MDPIGKIATPDIAQYNTTNVKPAEIKNEQPDSSGLALRNQEVPVQDKKRAVQKENKGAESVAKNAINSDNKDQKIDTEIYDLKAVFAIDKDKNVVIRFVDKEGKVKQQIPPEEYLVMAKKMKEITKNLYSKKA